MGTIAKTLLGVFFIVLVSLTGIQTVIGGTDVTEAQNYHEDVITEIECSNFNPEVIAGCISQAAQNGYALTVTPVKYDEDGNMQTAEVILKYNYGIKILNLSQEKSIRSFAR